MLLINGETPQVVWESPKITRATDMVAKHLPVKAQGELYRWAHWYGREGEPPLAYCESYFLDRIDFMAGSYGVKEHEEMASRLLFSLRAKHKETNVAAAWADTRLSVLMQCPQNTVLLVARQQFAKGNRNVCFNTVYLRPESGSFIWKGTPLLV